MVNPRICCRNLVKSFMTLPPPPRKKWFVSSPPPPFVFEKDGSFGIAVVPGTQTATTCLQTGEHHNG